MPKLHLKGLCSRDIKYIDVDPSDVICKVTLPNLYRLTFERPEIDWQIDWDKEEVTIHNTNADRIYLNLLVVEKFSPFDDFDKQLQKAQELGHYIGNERYEESREPWVRRLFPHSQKVYVDEYNESWVRALLNEENDVTNMESGQVRTVLVCIYMSVCSVFNGSIFLVFCLKGSTYLNFQLQRIIDIYSEYIF